MRATRAQAAMFTTFITVLSLSTLSAATAPTEASTAPQQGDRRTYVQDPNAYPKEASFPEVLRFSMTERPKELFDVLRVVDGDTIWIERNGERDKLRLLSVDTEEKYMKNNTSVSKPSTRYGEQSTGWAQGFFAPRAADEGRVRVGLRFPGGVESRDPYGRLLCHVVTEGGVDFNVLLVRMGFSPYFNKYGNSRIAHEEFVAAQVAARAERRGVWNEDTNKGGKARPYDQLVPWWQARADAVAVFRSKAAVAPTKFVAADEPDALQGALDAGGEDVTVLALFDREFDEDDGSKTVLLRAGDKKRALRVRVAKEDLAALTAFDLKGSQSDYRQNYLLISGKLVWGDRGFYLEGMTPKGWRRAGPEPKPASRPAEGGR